LSLVLECLTLESPLLVWRPRDTPIVFPLRGGLFRNLWGVERRDIGENEVGRRGRVLPLHLLQCKLVACCREIFGRAFGHHSLPPLGNLRTGDPVARGMPIPHPFEVPCNLASGI